MQTTAMAVTHHAGSGRLRIAVRARTAVKIHQAPRARASPVKGSVRPGPRSSPGACTATATPKRSAHTGGVHVGSDGCDAVSCAVRTGAWGLAPDASMPGMVAGAPVAPGRGSRGVMFLGAGSWDVRLPPIPRHKCLAHHTGSDWALVLSSDGCPLCARGPSSFGRRGELRQTAKAWKTGRPARCPRTRPERCGPVNPLPRPGGQAARRRRLPRHCVGSVPPLWRFGGRGAGDRVDPRVGQPFAGSRRGAARRGLLEVLNGGRGSVGGDGADVSVSGGEVAIRARRAAEVFRARVPL